MSEYCKNCYELAEKLQAKEQECEKLKKQLDKYLNQEEEEIRQLNNDNKLDEILSAISKANAQIEKESNYKQALKKIYKYCCDQNLKVDFTACEILEIINEVFRR